MPQSISIVKLCCDCAASRWGEMGGERSLMMSVFDVALQASALGKWEVARELCSQMTTQGSGAGKNGSYRRNGPRFGILLLLLGVQSQVLAQSRHG